MDGLLDLGTGTIMTSFPDVVIFDVNEKFKRLEDAAGMLF